MKITKKQLNNLRKAAERQARIESGVNYSPSTVHKTSKKDKHDKSKNTVNPREIGDSYLMCN